MYKIFTLHSAKYILSIEDLTPAELKMYKWYLSNEGLPQNNLFKNLIGDNYKPFNNINRYMYRIRYWIWFDGKQYYKLMDIDNYGNSCVMGEQGIISLDDEPFLFNISNSLFFVPNAYFTENRELISKFAKNLLEFQNVRRENKVTPSLRKAEIKLYGIYKKLINFSNTYSDEFKWTGTLSCPNGIVCDTFLKNFKHKIDFTYDLIFVNWNFRGIDYNLVTVKNENDSSTYFCDSKLNILKYNYINTAYPDKNILDKFRKRVYSFLTVAKILNDKITY